MQLMDHQVDAVNDLKNGSILWGEVGTGKSAVSLAYYVKNEAPKHIYVITTARKRDTLDWEKEAAKFGIGTEDYATLGGIFTCDSWNNLKHYTDIEGAFFVFDEQRVVGNGEWVKNFIKITKKNNWILLSGTPGDNWMDYGPVFVANGFFKNLTEFKMKHVHYAPFVRYPIVIGYINEYKLEMMRNEILVEMPYLKHTEQIHDWVNVGYNVELFNKVFKERWHVYEDRPIKDSAEMFRVLRRIVNSDPSRLNTIKKLIDKHPRLIIFYTFNYELEILRTLNDSIPTYEYNGHKKDSLPTSDKWCYLVQYTSGAEGWNCTSTDGMVLYSLTNSYKNFKQAPGRIDRLNTLYTQLYIYMFVSNSFVDSRIKMSLDNKKNFNERRFIREMEANGWEVPAT